MKKLLAAFLTVIISFTAIRPVYASDVISPDALPQEEQYFPNTDNVDEFAISGVAATILVFVLANYPQIYQSVSLWISRYGTQLTLTQAWDTFWKMLKEGRFDVTMPQSC